MIGDQSKFVTMRPKSGGKVAFEGNQSGRIARIGKIGEKDEAQTKDVYYVEGLCHNLLMLA